MKCPPKLFLMPCTSPLAMETNQGKVWKLVTLPVLSELFFFFCNACKSTIITVFLNGVSAIDNWQRYTGLNRIFEIVFATMTLPWSLSGTGYASRAADMRIKPPFCVESYWVTELILDKFWDPGTAKHHSAPTSKITRNGELGVWNFHIQVFSIKTMFPELLPFTGLLAFVWIMFGSLCSSLRLQTVKQWKVLWEKKCSRTFYWQRTDRELDDVDFISSSAKFESNQIYVLPSYQVCT